MGFWSWGKKDKNKKEEEEKKKMETEKKEEGDASKTEGADGKAAEGGENAPPAADVNAMIPPAATTAPKQPQSPPLVAASQQAPATSPQQLPVPTPQQVTPQRSVPGTPSQNAMSASGRLPPPMGAGKFPPLPRGKLPPPPPRHFAHHHQHHHQLQQQLTPEQFQIMMQMQQLQAAQQAAAMAAQQQQQQQQAGGTLSNASFSQQQPVAAQQQPPQQAGGTSPGPVANASFSQQQQTVQNASFSNRQQSPPSAAQQPPLVHPQSAEAATVIPTIANTVAQSTQRQQQQPQLQQQQQQPPPAAAAAPPQQQPSEHHRHHQSVLSGDDDSEIQFVEEAATPPPPVAPSSEKSVEFHSVTSSAPPKGGKTPPPKSTSKAKPPAPAPSKKKRTASASPPLYPRQNTPPPETEPKHKSTPSDAISKKFIAERFASILCPQQYEGKVVRLHAIRILAEVSKVNSATLFLAAMEDSSEPELFFPQVRLSRESCIYVRDDSDLCESRYLLCEATTGKMGFAINEGDAEQLFQQSSDVNSCFITDSSGIVFRDRADVKPVASIAVEWRPHSAPSAAQMCSKHNTVLDMYDMRAKELGCALCVAKTRPGDKDFVALCDILSDQSKKNLASTIEGKLQEVSRAVDRAVVLHQRSLAVGAKKLEAINVQFDMLIAAIESKRQEFLDAASNELTTFGLEASKEILIGDEHRRLLEAAFDHLRQQGSLQNPQIATIAQALQVNPRSRMNAVSPDFTGSSRLNLEGLMATVQSLSLLAADTSGMLNSAAGTMNNSLHHRSPRRQQHHQSPSKSGGLQHSSFGSPSKTLGKTLAAASLFPHITNGTCLFNCPIHELLTRSSVVEWKLRIDEPGEWVGVGVGVGGELASWAAGGAVDMNHIWVVPSNAPRALRLRVTVSQSGNAKLTVHDRNGTQLDDNRIGHWNLRRTCFPQVSFGSAAGRATMISPPTVIKGL